jgi:hypothetical protein
MNIKGQDTKSAAFLLQLTRSLVNEDLDRIVDERLNLRKNTIEKHNVIPAETGSGITFDFHGNITNHRNSNSF